MCHLNHDIALSPPGHRAPAQPGRHAAHNGAPRGGARPLPARPQAGAGGYADPHQPRTAGQPAPALKH